MTAAASDLLAEADVIDLHVESFIWTRVFGYDLQRWHARAALGNRLFGQADLPRLRAAGVTGVVMSIATNPLRTTAGRRHTLFRNLDRLRSTLAAAPLVDVVRDAVGYTAARAGGRLAAFLAIQGGNALGPDDLSDARLHDVSRITLVHLTRSGLGTASAPGGGDAGLTERGRRFVEALRSTSIGWMVPPSCSIQHAGSAA